MGILPLTCEECISNSHLHLQAYDEQNEVFAEIIVNRGYRLVIGGTPQAIQVEEING